MEEQSTTNPVEADANGASNPTTEEANLSQIRTFQGDVARALERDGTSIVSIQQQAQARREAAGEEAPQESKGIFKGILLTLGSVVLIALAGFGGFYTYKEYERKAALPEVVETANRIVIADREAPINSASLSRTSLIATVASTTAESDELLHMSFTPEITAENFFKILETRAPGSLVRSFTPSFMLGVFGTTSNFLIIELESYENAFAGMLAWESTLAEDMGPLFATRLFLTQTPLPYVFQDVTRNNKDARALLDPEGEVVLVYTFFNNEKLIITDSLDTMQSLLTRLTAELLSR